MAKYPVLKSLITLFRETTEFAPSLRASGNLAPVVLWTFASTLIAPAVFCADATQPANHMRIASFAPSNTELLYAIGASDKLVGVCSYCDYPEEAKKKTIVGNFISANLERLAGLKPDKIFLVSGQEALAGQLSHNGYKVGLLKNSRLEDISKNIKELASVTGSTARGDKVASQLDKSFKEFEQIISKSATKPRVFYCVWPQPLLTIGKSSYLTEAITECGGDSVSKDLEAGYPHFSLEKLVLANPDAIILPFECKDREFLKKHPWSALKAVKNNQVFFLPDAAHDGLARPTLRITTGFAWLAKRLHPELSTRLDAWLIKAQHSLNSVSASPITASKSGADSK